MPMPGNSFFDSRFCRLATVGVVLVVAAASLATVRPAGLPLHHDTTRDLHGALTALTTEKGPLVGPPTSAEGIVQGGFWTIHLATVLGLGGDMDFVAAVTFALAVLSLLALIAAGLAMWEGEVGIAAALVAACVLVSARATWTVQWNPSLLPLPAALTLLFAMEGLRHQRMLPLVLAAAALGLTAQLHPASWLLLPMATWSVWRYFKRCRAGPGRDRFLCWLLLAVMALLPFGLYGAEALYQSVMQLGQAGGAIASGGHHPTVWWCGAMLAAAGFHAFATIFRPAYARPVHNTVALWAGLPAAFFLLFYFWSGVQPSPRHLLPYLPAAALVVGALPTNLRRILPALSNWKWLRGVAPATALGVLVALTWTAHPPGVTYTYAEAQWVAEKLHDEGLCDPDVVAASLHGTHAWALHGAVEAYLVGAPGTRPCYRKEPTPRLVLRLPEEEPGHWPEDWQIGRTEDGSTLAILPLPGYLDWSEFQWRGSGDDAFHAARLRRDDALSSPGYPAWTGFKRAGQPGCIDLRVAMDVPAGKTAVVALPPQAPLGGTTAEVVAASKLDVLERGTDFVRVRRHADNIPGTLELRWCIDHPLPQEVIRGLPPVAVAVDDEGDFLLAALRAMEVVP